jgi:hypothetical protein
MLPGRRKMKKTLLLNYMFFILILICFPLSANVHAEGFSPWKIERLVGEKAPEFSVNDLSGKSVSLSSFKGKPTLLNFFLPSKGNRPCLISGPPGVLTAGRKDRTLTLFTGNIRTGGSQLLRFQQTNHLKRLRNT